MIFSGFLGRSEGDAKCLADCAADPQCGYMSWWPTSGWCKLTKGCTLGCRKVGGACGGEDSIVVKVLDCGSSSSFRSSPSPSPPPPPPPPRPLIRPAPANKHNILFIMADDLAPMLGTYGRQAGFQPAITPVLDQFAAEASLFETAYAQVPTCGASRASLMTSLYATPTRFIQFDTWAELEAPGIADLPKVLMSHGYTTISSGKIYHKRLDNEHSWNEICGFGIVSQPSPYRRCPKLRSLDNQTSNLLVSHCVMSRPPPAGNACVLLSQPRKVLRMSEQSVACVSARVVCVGSFVGRVGIACLLAVPVAS